MSWQTSGMVFACVFAGALLGMYLRTSLPTHHLGADSKELKVGMGLIATLFALVLGLLIASAKQLRPYTEKRAYRDISQDCLPRPCPCRLRTGDEGQPRCGTPDGRPRARSDVAEDNARPTQLEPTASPGPNLSMTKSRDSRRRPTRSARSRPGAQHQHPDRTNALVAVRADGRLDSHAFPGGAGFLAHHPLRQLGPLLALHTTTMTLSLVLIDLPVLPS